MKRKQVALVVLVLLSIGTAIGVYAGTVGVNNLFGFDNITADVEYYRNGVNYTQFIASRYGSDQSLNTTDAVTFDTLTLTGDLINTYNVTQALQYPQQPASYIIWNETGVIYAKNGTTGAIDYSGVNASTVINNALGALTPGRTWQEVVVLKGLFSIGDTIDVSSYTFLDLTGAELRLNLNIGAGDPLMQTEANAEQVTIFGGILSGNRYVVGHHATVVLNIRGDAGGDFGDGYNRVLYTQIKQPKSLGISADSRRALYIGVTVFDGGQHGFDVASSDQTFISCSVKTVLANAWVIRTPFNYFYKIIAEDAGQRGIWIYGSDGIFNYIDGGYSEWNGEEGLYIDNSFQGAANGNTIKNMNFIKNVGPAIYVNTSDNLFYGNRFYDNEIIPTQTWAIEFGTNSTNNLATTNIIGDNPQTISDNGTENKIYRNVGYVTENSGTATIPNATTSIYIPHGCGYTPSATDISYVFTENPTNAITYQYVGNLTATGFTVYTNDPGASNLDLSWQVIKTP